MTLALALEVLDNLVQSLIILIKHPYFLVSLLLAVHAEPSFLFEQPGKFLYLMAFGIGLLLQTKQVKKMISSYVGENAEFERQLLSGELEVELIPQGTLATRCMASGYGMPVIFTPAGVGTEVAIGKEVRNFNGKDYLMEYAFDADFAIVKAWKGDTEGNLIFKATARNFNPLMAMAGKITIAEVEELVPAGTLDPNYIHTPGIYVHRIFEGMNYEKRIEQRTVRSEM